MREIDPVGWLDEERILPHSESHFREEINIDGFQKSELRQPKFLVSVWSAWQSDVQFK